MSVPTYDRFIEPVLRILFENPGGLPATEVARAAADRLGLSEEDRAQLIPSGQQPLYKNRIGWAHDRLKRAELSQSVRRGVWQLTPKGIAYARAHAQPLAEGEITAITDADAAVPQLKGKAQPPSNPPPLRPASDPERTPQERLEDARAEIVERTRRELLERILQRDHLFFEQMVIELLHKMGYGLSQDSLRHTGGSGDGGIDGVISLDRLGLEHVCIQAKRYQRNHIVGPSTVRELVGSLSEFGATKGVLITTSGFSSEARKAAENAKTARVALIDGPRLADLMMEHGIGISHQILRIPKVDVDYFEESD